MAYNTNHLLTVGHAKELYSNLKSAFNKRVPILPVYTSFFENVNYGISENVTFVSGVFADTSGKIQSGANTNSLIVDIMPSTTYYFYAPSRNRKMVCESQDDFVIGNTYTRIQEYEDGSYGGIALIKFTTSATAKRVFLYFYSGTYDYNTNKNNIIISANNFSTSFVPKVKGEYLDITDVLPAITPEKTSFFDIKNYYNLDHADFYAGKFTDTSGKIQSGANTNSLVIPVEPSKTYWFYAPSMNRSMVVESDTDIFATGSTYTTLVTRNQTAPYSFTTGSTARYVFVYFYSGTYDYEANKNDIVLNIGSYIGNLPPTVKEENLPNGVGNVLSGKNVLIFGDSITDCCNLTINASNETTAYSWKNPSNSYVNAGGTTVNYSMWPKILKDSQGFTEIRNYARQGASYKTSSRTSGEERQNLQYQITVALNDKNNPNHVFDIDDFLPDIIIFALGTNDGTPNDTFDSAMSKTVLQSDGYTIDVSATLAALDETKFCESARKAFIRIKQAFPMAQIFCVLPIQRANNEVNFGTLHQYLTEMAKRYGCIIIDGAGESGITRDFNVWNAVGEYLKDGLHPNEKGQNLMARMILSALRSHYIPFGTGFNIIT